MAIAAAGTFLAANAGTIAAATMVGQTVMQGIEARKQAERQAEYQKQQNQRAIESMQDQYSQLSGAEADARERAVQEGMNNKIEAAKRKSQINLMAAASGTAGLSVDSMMRDISQQRGRNMDTILRNQDIELQGFRNQAEQIRTGTAGRIDNRKIQKPSWAEIGINAGAQALQGYASMSGAGGGGGNPQATMQGTQASGGLYGNIATGGV